jgi:hypothetical protein
MEVWVLPHSRQQQQIPKAMEVEVQAVVLEETEEDQV